MIWTSILGWVQQAVPFAAFLALAALGELLTEKAGSLNLGTPGTMCVGASAGFITVYSYCNAVEEPSVVLILLISLGSSFLAAMLLGLLYSFFTVSLRINQNVVGLVLTIFGCGLAEFLSYYFIKSESGNVRCEAAFRVFTAKIPFLSEKLGWASEVFFRYGFMLYVTIGAVIVLSLFLYHTRAGLHLRAVGENPGTADAAGISVTKYRYLASSIGAGLVGVLRDGVQERRVVDGGRVYARSVRLAGGRVGHFRALEAAEPALGVADLRILLLGVRLPAAAARHHGFDRSDADAAVCHHDSRAHSGQSASAQGGSGSRRARIVLLPRGALKDPAKKNKTVWNRKGRCGGAPGRPSHFIGARKYGVFSPSP